ncbi:MAG: glycoside hydrolase family 3 protein [Spirochaetaceae bacterium]|nr:glycoside hydrolase family 3 protein [Spirochaetaceae bacterium]
MPPEEGGVREKTADETLRERAGVIAAALNDSELAGQVIMTAVDGKGRLFDASRNRLRTVKPGAVLLFKANVDSTKSDIAMLNAEIGSCASLAVGTEAGLVLLPPLIAVDHEGGLVHRFGAGVEHLPAPLAYGDMALAEGKYPALRKIEQDAFRSGKEIAELGFTMNLAPVVEVLDDSNKQFLVSRAYGYDLDFVVDAAAAFVRGMRRAGVLCVIKHFPGNSNLDPHETLPVLSISGRELDDYRAPFASVIRIAEPSGLMVSHVIVKEWDAEHNASLSPEVIQRQIRQNLMFSRIIITDDLAMGAVASLRIEEASVSAIAAGADMVITWPSTLLDVHAAILAALKNGSIPRVRLVEAATNIITEKLRLRAE